ncbi:hypothetical protein, conserved [Eimeria acervulina]|uniref:UAS domain-containing protein n=1 Tax=Eimeria acervulina TaxID=5801 RepID=U6GEN4_EIMAC|nr:hypothetical protein, conserved [Eimeria acervulina]CDI77009.1 hypothetical protein, conserved [Eimeria acervulina]
MQNTDELRRRDVAGGRLPTSSNARARAFTTPTFPEMFEAKYGNRHPPFFSGSLRDAFGEARVLQKPLVVYLHGEGPSSDLTCREALSSSLFIELLETHGCLFAATWSRSREGVALQRLLQLHAFPCLLIFIPNPIFANSPPRDPNLNWLRAAHNWLHTALQGSWGEAEAASHAVGAIDRLEELQQICNEKQEALRQTQILRREQEAAFEEIQRQESLRLSLQREEKRQQEQELQRRQQEARRQEQKRAKMQQQQQLLQQQRAAAAADFKAQDEECSKLPPEQRATICLKLACGKRITRIFSSSSSLSLLYRWCGCVAEYCEVRRQLS